MNYIIKKAGILVGIFVALFVSSCEDVAPVIEEIQFDRVFIPIEVEVKIRNQVTAEVSWAVAENVDRYVLQFSKDSLEFNSIDSEVEVLPVEVPFSIPLEGATQYSVRIKGVSSLGGQEDSKWTNGVAFKTKEEQIFDALPLESIHATSVELTWAAGSDVTHFLITPGDVRRDITEDEKAAGKAIISNLTGETAYEVTLYNNEAVRGKLSFTTPVDIGDATAVHPEDDLAAIIAAAQEGDVLALFPGDYLVSVGEIKINKSISLKAVKPAEKPVLHAQFVLEDGAQEVVFESLSLNGNYFDTETQSPAVANMAFQYATEGAFGSLDIIKCEVDSFTKSFISGGSVAFSAASINVDDCVVSNIFTDGGDFIDFRASFIAELVVQNSTFINCATENNRDFFRMDGASKGNTYDNGANTPDITVTTNTFYNSQNNASGGKRFFYVRWQNSPEVIAVERNMFVNATSNYSSSSDTDMPTFSNNNYFNAAGFLDSSKKIYDNSGTHSELDPGFVDPANGDLTVTNQDLIDDSIGDPRWR